MANISAAQAGTVQIGDITVNRLGLGTNRITDTPEAHRLLARAVDLDVNFIDTAYGYQDGASETAIASSLAPYKKGLVVATKGGWEDTHPDELRGLLETSLRRLKVDCIDLYQLHRLNPNVPLEESVGMFKRFQEEGKIRHIGLSEVTLEQLRRAQEVATIVSVQNEYNVVNRKHEDLVNYCTQQNVVFIPWFPLGGLRGDAERVNRLLNDIALEYYVTPPQLALAWLLRRSPIMLPIPGTLSIPHLENNVAAAAIKLTDNSFERMSAMTA